MVSVLYTLIFGSKYLAYYRGFGMFPLVKYLIIVDAYRNALLAQCGHADTFLNE